jgi:hypothetical protein
LPLAHDVPQLLYALHLNAHDRASDLEGFDLIVGMDGANKAAVLEAAHFWGKREVAEAKLRNMTDYCTKHKSPIVVRAIDCSPCRTICRRHAI